MRVCVFDTETTINSTTWGPDWRSPQNDFHTIIYGESPNNVKVVHKLEGFGRELDEAHDVLMSADLVVGHNLPFDLGYIIHHWKERREMPNVWDTQIAQYLLSGQRHSFASLAELQNIYLGAKVKKDKISKLYKRGIGADKIMAAKDRCKRIWALYDEYCYDDGRTTLQVFKAQYELAKKLSILNIIKTYNQYMVSLVIMMSEGIKVNLPGTERTIRDFELLILEKLQAAEEIIKVYWTDPRLPPFNISSSAHKSAVLFGGNIPCDVVVDNGFYKNGNPRTKREKQLVYVKGMGIPNSISREGLKKGQYETGKAIIQNILHTTNNPVIKEYCALQLEGMNLKKVVSTYLKAYLKYNINGYVYPKFNNTSVITGRLSSSGGINFQNQPASGPMLVHIQGQLCAPEGFTCCAIDWSQLEMYIAAWNSKDQALIDDLIVNNLDFHCQSLAFAEQATYEEIHHKVKVLKLEEYELKRKKAKPITFQKTYGAGYKRVARETGLEEDVVKRVFDGLDAKYWKLKLFNDHVFERVKQNTRVSLAKNIPAAQKGNRKESRRFNDLGQELLPIMQGENKYFNKQYIREIGYYKMPHGKIYSFEEYGELNKEGKVKRGFAMPQVKNYTCQGGAADAVAAVTNELMAYSLQHYEEVKIISTIHDSLWFYIKKGTEDLHIPALCDIMVQVPKALKKWLNVNLDFNFAVEATVGDNFGEQEKFNGQKT